jgi:hypothetical protein
MVTYHPEATELPPAGVHDTHADPTFLRSRKTAYTVHTHACIFSRAARPRAGAYRVAA